MTPEDRTRLHETNSIENPTDYIGDGVYVEYDGYGVWLKTERANGWHKIYLDPDVMAGLINFVQRAIAEVRARDDAV